MEFSQERVEQLLQQSAASVKTRKLSSKQCFLLGFKQGLQSLIDEIGPDKFNISSNRRDQLRRVAWNQVSIAGGAPNGSADETFRLGFELGWKAAKEEFAKQNQA